MRLSSPLDKLEFLRLLKLGMEFGWLYQREESFMEMWMGTANNNTKTLIEHLIRNFLYVDSNMADEFCNSIVKQIVEGWKLKAGNTFLSAICDNSRPDGSQVIVQKLKNRFPDEWKEFYFINSIAEAAYKLNSNENLILCDDFIGTGNTFNRKIAWVQEKLGERGVSNVSIYIVAFASMSFSEEHISCPMYTCRKLPKGISERLAGKNRLIAIELMKSLESMLKPKVGKLVLPKFGYKKSESLFDYEDDNIPNNVFPIFWWKRDVNNKRRQTMFNRV